MARRKDRKKTVRPVRSRSTRKVREVQRPRTLRQFRAMTPDNQERWIQALNTVAKMRAEGTTLTKTARASGTDAKTVKSLVGSSLRKDRRGRIVATERDRHLRVLQIPGPKGAREVAVRDSRTASYLATYADAVRKYIRRGDPSPLQGFRRLVLKDANGRRIGLVTNLRKLNELGHAGVLSFETMYVRSAS